MLAFRRKRGAAKIKRRVHTYKHTYRQDKINNSIVRVFRQVNCFPGMSGSEDFFFCFMLLILFLSGLLHGNRAQPQPSCALNGNIGCWRALVKKGNDVLREDVPLDRAAALLQYPMQDMFVGQRTEE